MFQLTNLGPDQVKKFVRRISQGELLFKKGDLGNTMFIIVSGAIELVEDRGNQTFVVGTLPAGDVLGEKAMLSDVPYRRTYGARARGEVIVLEFDSKNIKALEAGIPNFASRILEIAAKRVDRMNQIVHILRSLDPVERFVQTILFLSRQNATKTSAGLEITADIDEIFSIASIDRTIIQTCLTKLLEKKILRKTSHGYLLSDPNALLQYSSELRERVAA